MCMQNCFFFFLKQSTEKIPGITLFTSCLNHFLSPLKQVLLHASAELSPGVLTYNSTYNIILCYP